LVEIKKDFRDVIKKFKAVAIDTQVFIYHFQENATYLPLTQTIFKAIEHGEMNASTSVMTLMEILTKPMREGDAKAVEEYKFVLQTFPNLKLQSVDAAVSEKAAEIRAAYNLRSPDAIELASAIAANAEAFLTNDHRLKRIKGIQVIVLKEHRNRSAL
jgi:predicted nucleic acid-binding protein